MKIPNIEEARAMLWEEFEHAPDQSIELIVQTFNIIAKLLIDKIENESG